MAVLKARVVKKLGTGGEKTVTKTYPQLSSSFAIGKTTIKNRFAVAPMDPGFDTRTSRLQHFLAQAPWVLRSFAAWRLAQRCFWAT